MAACLLLFCFMLIRPTSLTFVGVFFRIVTVSRLFERYPFMIRSDVTFVIFLRQKCVSRQLNGHQLFVQCGAYLIYFVL